MFDLYSAVHEFHRVYRVPIGAQPAIDVDQLDLRDRLLCEELEELVAAEALGDVIETVDALADILYILTGTAIVHGLPLPATDAADLACRGACKVGTDAIADLVDLVDLACRSGDTGAATERIAELDAVVRTRCARERIPIDAVLAEVHASNLSKLDADGQPLYRHDGKVAKGPRFWAPNIAAVLADHAY